jgi:hypothetical protein
MGEPSLVRRTLQAPTLDGTLRRSSLIAPRVALIRASRTAARDPICQLSRMALDKLSDERAVTHHRRPALTAASLNKLDRGAGQPDVVRHLWARIRLAAGIRPTA